MRSSSSPRKKQFCLSSFSVAAINKTKQKPTNQPTRKTVTKATYRRSFVWACGSRVRTHGGERGVKQQELDDKSRNQSPRPDLKQMMLRIAESLSSQILPPGTGHAS